MLDEEGDVESDEEQPEVDLAQRLVQHPAGQLGPPEVEAGEHRKDHRAEHHVMEVRDHEVRVRNREVQRRAGQHNAGEATEQEGRQEADSPEHGRSHGDIAAPHGADPVEELHSGRHGDQEGHEGEERQVDRPGDEHVVRPHRDGQGADQHRGPDKAHITEDRLPAEHRQNLGDDAEERQGDDVDLGMAEEPEQVLPQERSAIGRRRRRVLQGPDQPPAPTEPRRESGRRTSTRNDVTRMFQVKIGIRNMVMPGARMHRIVVVKLTAPRMVPRPAM